MRIGIASDDQVNIAGHFGRTRGFVIAEVEDGKMVGKTYRQNVFTNHTNGEHEHHDHGSEQAHGHSHSAIIQALSDCQSVIAKGMGRRIYEDLREHHIQSTITNMKTVDDAIQAYLAGTLEDNPEKGCQH